MATRFSSSRFIHFASSRHLVGFISSCHNILYAFFLISNALHVLFPNRSGSDYTLSCTPVRTSVLRKGKTFKLSMMLLVRRKLLIIFHKADLTRLDSWSELRRAVMCRWMGYTFRIPYFLTCAECLWSYQIKNRRSEKWSREWSHTSHE